MSLTYLYLYTVIYITSLFTRGIHEVNEQAWVISKTRKTFEQNSLGTVYMPWIDGLAVQKKCFVLIKIYNFHDHLAQG